MREQERQGIRNFASQIQNYIFREGIFLPIPIHDVIQSLGGSITYDLQEPLVDGKIARIPTEESEKREFNINIRLAISKVKERFILAHELGHLFLHMGFLNDEQWNLAPVYEDGAFRRIKYDFGTEELQANEFAASFLMPEEHFIRIAEENTVDDLLNIELIANKFGVSQNAAIVRGMFLGIFVWRN